MGYVVAGIRGTSSVVRDVLIGRGGIKCPGALTHWFGLLTKCDRLGEIKINFRSLSSSRGRDQHTGCCLIASASSTQPKDETCVSASSELLL